MSKNRLASNTGKHTQAKSITHLYANTCNELVKCKHTSSEWYKILFTITCIYRCKAEYAKYNSLPIEDDTISTALVAFLTDGIKGVLRSVSQEV